MVSDEGVPDAVAEIDPQEAEKLSHVWDENQRHILDQRMQFYLSSRQKAFWSGVSDKNGEQMRGPEALQSWFVNVLGFPGHKNKNSSNISGSTSTSGSTGDDEEKNGSGPVSLDVKHFTLENI